MSLRSVLIKLLYWVILVTAVCFASTYLFNNSTINQATMASAIFFALQAYLLIFIVWGASKMPNVNITMVIFATVMLRFLLTASFFTAYKFIVLPKGYWFALPFGILFVVYSGIENIFLLQYANNIEKVSKTKSD